MVTEGVEPGVYRVINDGVRDLTAFPEEHRPTATIVAGHDGASGSLAKPPPPARHPGRPHDPGADEGGGCTAFAVAPERRGRGPSGSTNVEGWTAVRSYGGHGGRPTRTSNDGNLGSLPTGHGAGRSLVPRRARRVWNSLVRMYPDVGRRGATTSGADPVLATCADLGRRRLAASTAIAHAGAMVRFHAAPPLRRPCRSPPSLGLDVCALRANVDGREHTRTVWPAIR